MYVLMMSFAWSLGTSNIGTKKPVVGKQNCYLSNELPPWLTFASPLIYNIQIEISGDAK